jgi:RING finger protein 121
MSTSVETLEQKHMEELKKHQGHESQHLMMVLILVTVMLLSQIGLVWWKTKYQKSYIHCSMIAMYIFPFCISAYRLWWRFVSIWMIVTLITVVLVWRPLIMPNFAGSGSTIPRLLYKWFFAIYSISSIIAVTGYVILVLTFFGINLLLNISPQVALDIGFMMLFYGIYYGVLCRDFTDFLVDRLAARIGYYNPSSALPSKSLRNNVCAICGMEHGDKEDIDIDGITKNEQDVMLLGDQDVMFESGLHPDREVLISSSDQDERLFVLTCGHKFHEYCIYGWCLIGKRQTCPFCREKVDLGRMFSALPFQKPHQLYGNLLEFIRYLFAW